MSSELHRLGLFVWRKIKEPVRSLVLGFDVTLSRCRFDEHYHTLSLQLVTPPTLPHCIVKVELQKESDSERKMSLTLW